MTDEAYFYILAGNQPTDGKVPLYVGSTRDLARRVSEHRTGLGSRHTARYRIARLVYYESYESLEEARVREYRVKRWHRAWKDRLIGKLNPEWKDLYRDLA